MPRLPIVAFPLQNWTLYIIDSYTCASNSKRVTYSCISMTTVVMRTRYNVTLCLSFVAWFWLCWKKLSPFWLNFYHVTEKYFISWLQFKCWPPSSVEVKNEWSFTPTPPVCLHGVCRDGFTLFLYPFNCLNIHGNFWRRSSSPILTFLRRCFEKLTWIHAGTRKFRRIPVLCLSYLPYFPPLTI